MDRMIQANVIAMSGRAVEAAGDVDVLLLDKTGTITLGNRQASAFVPADGVPVEALADAAQLSSLADETPEGRSIVVLAKEKIQPAGSAGDTRTRRPLRAVHRPDTYERRQRSITARSARGAADAVEAYVIARGGEFPASVRETVSSISRQGGTPLVVADGKSG